jgi:hypothetical protein
VAASSGGVVFLDREAAVQFPPNARPVSCAPVGNPRLRSCGRIGGEIMPWIPCKFTGDCIGTAKPDARNSKGAAIRGCWLTGYSTPHFVQLAASVRDIVARDRTRLCGGAGFRRAGWKSVMPPWNDAPRTAKAASLASAQELASRTRRPRIDQIRAGSFVRGESPLTGDPCHNVPFARKLAWSVRTPSR